MEPASARFQQQCGEPQVNHFFGHAREAVEISRGRRNSNKIQGCAERARASATLVSARQCQNSGITTKSNALEKRTLRLSEKMLQRPSNFKPGDISPPFYLKTSAYPYIDEFWNFCLQLQYKKFWESGDIATVLISSNFGDAWKAHLTELKRELHISGCESLISKAKPHIIHIWSAAHCTLTMDMGTESTVKAFWLAAAPSLRQLLSTWSGTARTSHGHEHELVRDALTHIRQVRPAWPNLGECDVQRLAEYVVSESELCAACSGQAALETIPVPNIFPHLSFAVAYSADKSFEDLQNSSCHIARTEKKRERQQAKMKTRKGGSGHNLEDLANAAAVVQAAEIESGNFVLQESGEINPRDEHEINPRDELEGARESERGLDIPDLSPSEADHLRNAEDINISPTHSPSYFLRSPDHATTESGGQLNVDEGAPSSVSPVSSAPPAPAPGAEGAAEAGPPKQPAAPPPAAAEALSVSDGPLQSPDHATTESGGQINMDEGTPSSVSPVSSAPPAPAPGAEGAAEAGPPKQPAAPPPAAAEALSVSDGSLGKARFTELGYHSLNIEFSPEVKKELDALMQQTIRTPRISRVQYHSGHTGYQINRNVMYRLLPYHLRRVLITQPVVETVQSYFGNFGSPTLFACEVHKVDACAPQQINHADIIVSDAVSKGMSAEEISKLAVICIISTDGPITTLVYPNTRASIESEEDLDGMSCVRITEDHNCGLFDASMVHKGSANVSDEDNLKFIFTFIQASASAKQVELLKSSLSVNAPLNLSVEQFLAEPKAAANKRSRDETSAKQRKKTRFDFNPLAETTQKAALPISTRRCTNTTPYVQPQIQIQPCKCIVGSKVQGLFDKKDWYRGEIVEIGEEKTKRYLKVRFEDETCERYWPHKTKEFKKELRHDPSAEDDKTWMWNIIHSRLCAMSESELLPWEDTDLIQNICQEHDKVCWTYVQTLMSRALSIHASKASPGKGHEQCSRTAEFQRELRSEQSPLRVLMLVLCLREDGTVDGSLQNALGVAKMLRGVREIARGESGSNSGAESQEYGSNYHSDACSGPADNADERVLHNMDSEVGNEIRGARDTDTARGESEANSGAEPGNESHQSAVRADACSQSCPADNADNTDLFDLLVMQAIPGQMNWTGDVWDEDPYAKVLGKIGTVEGKEFFVHATLGEGDCFYIALAISIYKAWGYRQTGVLYSVFPEIYAERLIEVIKIGQVIASGRDRSASTFRELLSVHTSTAGPGLERALLDRGCRTIEVEPGPAQSTRSRRDASTLCGCYSMLVARDHSPANEGVFEILMDFLPILKLHIFVTNGRTQEPCRYFHSPTMNAFPQFDGQQLSIALHHRNSASEMGQADGSIFNHYEVVTGIEWSACIEALACSLAHQVPLRSNGDRSRGQQGEDRSRVQPGGLGKRIRTEVQSKLLQYFQPSTGSSACSKCGGQGDYECTRFDGERKCATSYCHKCMGHKMRQVCPSGFACEYHREILRLPVTLRFSNTACWECPERATDFCNICGKGLCCTHAQTTPSAADIFGQDGANGCRACLDTEAFSKSRALASKKLLREITGRVDAACVDTNLLDVAISTKISQLGAAKWTLLVDDFSVFIYSLFVGGLCQLAADYLKVLILINLRMFNLNLFMGLLPLQFCYMIARDRAEGMANGRMLCMVLVAFGSHIHQNEVMRRQRAGIDISSIGALNAQPRLHGGKVKVGFYAWDLMKTSPTLDLLYGSLMGMDEDKFELYLITFSRLPTKPVQQFGKRLPPEYDTSNEQVINLAKRFKKRIVYLYEKSSDDENLARLMRLGLHVLYHVNGYQHGHIWRLLLMARVALVYIEYLASPFLLLSSLPDFTISSPGLPSLTQLDNQSREKLILVPWMYATESYFLEDILGFTPSSPDLTPCLIYFSGLGRWNDSFVICVAMEIIHGCGGDLLLKVQTDPDTMYSHLRQIASKYCSEQGWPDYSNNIVTFPHFKKKVNLIRYGECHPRHVVFAVGSVQPHTGTVDADLMGCASLSLEGDDWPGRVTHVNNKLLGLSSLLNATSREDLVKKACRLFKDLDLLDRVVAHMKLYRRLRRGPYQDGSTFLQVAAVSALEQVMAVGGDRSKLSDIDLTGNPALEWEPIPEFEDESTKISYLGLSTAQRVSGIMCKMKANWPRYSWGNFGPYVSTLLESIECQAGLEFMDVAGCGGSRFALLAKVKEPDTYEKQAEIGWFHGQEAIVKLLHPSQDGELPSIKSLYNDPNLREGKLLMVAERPLARAGRMRSCLPKLLPVLPGSASAGFMKCGGPSDIVTFIICQAVGKSWYHSDRRSEIATGWRTTGVIGENFRSFTRNLLHSGWYLHDHLGIAVMDGSVSNICETFEKIPWLLHDDIQAQMPTPSGFVFCDLGSGYDIGTRGQRSDGDVRRGNEQRDKVLCRMATNVPEAKRPHRPCPRVPKSDVKGVVILCKHHIYSIFQHRRGTGHGLGRLTVGTRDNRCEKLADMWRNAPKGTSLSGKDCVLVDSGCYGNIIFGQVCPRGSGMTEADYKNLKEEAVKSPKAMQRVLESFVNTGVIIKQKETVESLANLLHWMLHPEIDRRIDIMTALCHPFTSLRILSTEEYEATRGTGYIIPGGYGPAGSPWEQVEFPAWNVKHVPGKGLGCFAVEPIRKDSKKPAALYCALHFKRDQGEAAYEWPPGRCNISISIGAGTNLALGELPLAVLRERRSAGALFNAGDSKSPANLSLKRLEFWADGKGLVYIPLYATKDINESEEGLWIYPHQNGAAGALSSFNDARFMVTDSKLGP